MTTSIQSIAGRPAGVYVHIPFCERLCPYCDFAVAVRHDQPDEAYLDALLGEFAVRHAEMEGRDVRSIYFGGGTPSAWPAEYLARVIDVVSDVLDVHEDAEITVEANPVSATDHRIEVWQLAGVNRVSLGVQSFSNRYLDALGRNHDGAEAFDALDRLMEAELAVSMDLIVGGPGNDMPELERDLQALSTSDVGHVSVYQMTLEPRTVFWKRQQQGRLGLPGEDETAGLLEHAQQGLKRLGFERYEVSSYARPGQRAVHNQNYWTGGEYLGLGMGAHSFAFVEGVPYRRANVRNLKSYLSSSDEPAEIERMDALDHLRERLFLGARSMNGVHPERLREQFEGTVGEHIWDEVERIARDFVDHGLLEEVDGVFVPTVRGLMLCDTLAESFFDVG